MTITAAGHTLGQFDQLGLPWDLREWLEREEILQTLARLLETIDWSNPSVVAFEEKHPAFRPRMFLTLLPYAYAIGLYSSQDIAEACYTDQTFRSISAGDPPTPRNIMAFRRENRGLIQWLMVELFKQAIKTKFDLGDFLVPTGLKKCLADAATERLDVARHIDRGAREE